MHFRIYLIYSILTISLSVNAQHQLDHCYNLNPVVINDDDFEKDIKSHAYFLKDSTRELNFIDGLRSLDNCEFLSEKAIGKLPTEFKCRSVQRI